MAFLESSASALPKNFRRIRRRAIQFRHLEVSAQIGRARLLPSQTFGVILSLYQSFRNVIDWTVTPVGLSLSLGTFEM